jgi:hypothetical protein
VSEFQGTRVREAFATAPDRMQYDETADQAASSFAAASCGGSHQLM